MKKLMIIAGILTLNLSTYAQKKLVKDIDLDGKMDTVYLDEHDHKITCRLSTQNFKKIKSKKIETAGDNTLIEPKKTGFEMNTNWMRSGYACQFRYEKNEKRIRLIGVSEYALGNATNDGSGEASINLLTGEYVGNWHYFDHLANNEKGMLIKIPTIKAKMQFKKIYLEDFDEEQYHSISEKFRALVERYKNLELKRREKH
ncbi:hypothetical protein [Pedobacter suwonensis]|uniref:hypothetical protein n=1 Tax=Pedobacter suwonensis TaxID=332999 RepID=UPI0025D4AC1E|nr:hypothetical protein [uncultured Pedobacter sp.]